MYYPYSENKDADQLRGYREADLRLCFRPCKLLVFSRTGSFILFYNVLFKCHSYKRQSVYLKSYMNRRIRKPTFYICKNKSADQLCSNSTADQCQASRQLM